MSPPAPSLHPSSSHNSGIQTLASSSASEPPPYSRHTSLDDPFRDGEAPVGSFYPNSIGVQKGLRPATATHAETRPATTVTLVDRRLPSIPTSDANPFVGGTVIEEDFYPPLPPQPPGLRRGLQIPSRVSLITWGFSFPKVLPEQGVTKEQWRRFKHELERFARVTISQRLTIVGYELIVHHFLGPIPATVVGWKMKKHREHSNFHVAYRGGSLKMFEDQWNDDYFHPLGLHVRIEPPDIGRMDDMDVASSKLYKYQQKMGIPSPAPGVASKGADKKEYRYQFKEGRHRMKATRKGRIIILPYKTVNALPSQSRSTDFQSHNSQSQGVTEAGAGILVQDFAT